MIAELSVVAMRIIQYGAEVACGFKCKWIVASELSTPASLPWSMCKAAIKVHKTMVT